MNVNELLDTIEDALEEGANVPLSGGKKIVDVEQIRDLLDEIRANLPGELRQGGPAARRRDHLCSADGSAHPAPDCDRLLRQHAQEHRGDHGGECGAGEECAGKPAPEREEKRLSGPAFYTQITHTTETEAPVGKNDVPAGLFL